MRFQKMITLDEVHDLWIKINNPHYKINEHYLEQFQYIEN